jgi:uncharacterized protein YcfJ
MKGFIVILLLFMIAGCSKTPTLSGVNGVKADKISYQGKITDVKYERKSSFMEDLGVFIVGDLIGSQLGGGDGSVLLGVVGGVLASDHYEKNLADEYTELNVLANGHNYAVHIKGHLELKVGRAVKVSIEDEKISGILLLENKNQSFPALPSTN